MQELPRLFNDAAEFVEPDAATVAALSGELVQALHDIRACYNATQEAEQNVEGAAQDEITEALAQVAMAETAVKPYGDYGFHNLWKQMVKQE